MAAFNYSHYGIRSKLISSVELPLAAVNRFSAHRLALVSRQGSRYPRLGRKCWINQVVEQICESLRPRAAKRVKGHECSNLRPRHPSSSFPQFLFENALCTSATPYWTAVSPFQRSPNKTADLAWPTTSNRKPTPPTMSRSTSPHGRPLPDQSQLRRRWLQ